MRDKVSHGHVTGGRFSGLITARRSSNPQPIVPGHEPEPRGKFRGDRVKNTAVVRKLPLSNYERAALEIFNADLHRSFPEVDLTTPSARANLVRAAMLKCSSRFELCKQAVKLTRALHDSNSQRVPATINRSLQFIATSGRKPVAKVAAA